MPLSHEDLRDIKMVCKEVGIIFEDCGVRLEKAAGKCNPRKKRNMNDHLRIDLKDLLTKFKDETMSTLSRAFARIHAEMKEYGNSLKEFDVKMKEVAKVSELQEEIQKKNLEISQYLAKNFKELELALTFEKNMNVNINNMNKQKPSSDSKPKKESLYSPSAKGDLTPQFAPCTFLRKTFETSKDAKLFPFPSKPVEDSSSHLSSNVKMEQLRKVEQNYKLGSDNKSTSSSSARRESEKGFKSPIRRSIMHAENEDKAKMENKDIRASKMTSKNESDGFEIIRLKESVGGPTKMTSTSN